jgi:hypothetical protein
MDLAKATLLLDRRDGVLPILAKIKVNSINAVKLVFIRGRFLQRRQIVCSYE